MRYALVLPPLAIYLCLVASPPATLPAAAATYKVDPVHSMVIFKVKHMGAGNFYGRFNQVSGTFTIDDADASKSAIEFEVKADSVDTGNPQRDKHLKNPDFLNSAQFPSITFKGKEIKKTGENTFDVAGNLTLHGVTKPLTVKAERVGTGKGQKGNPIAGFEATFTVKRSDFAMNFMIGPIGDEVQITVSVECTSS